MSTSPTQPARSILPTRGRIAIEVAGFAIGLGLLTWLVVIAVRDGDWTRVAEADGMLLFGLLACTLISAVLNGATFWITSRPVQRLGLLELQGVNLVASMLNYAPVRLGMVSRFVWHMRVDRMRLLDVLAWFAAVAVLIFCGLLVVLCATAVSPGIDAIWVVVLLVGWAVCGAIIRWPARLSIVRRHGRGFERMLDDPAARWGGLALRLLDVLTFAGRIACALAILGLELSSGQIVVLGAVAMLSNLIPVGRLGIREFAVAWTAARLGATSTTDVPWEQLALLESAGEVLVYLPLGICASIWFVLGLRRGPRGQQQ